MNARNYFILILLALNGAVSASLAGASGFNCSGQNCEAPVSSTSKDFNLVTDTSGITPWSPFDALAGPAASGNPSSSVLPRPYNTDTHGFIDDFCYSIQNRAPQGVFVPMGTPAEFASFVNSNFVNGGSSNAPLLQACTANPANECGTDNGGNFSSTPSGPGLCSSSATLSGSVSGPSGSPQKYLWTCTDTSSGMPASCSANYVANCSGGTASWNGSASGCSAAAPSGTYSNGNSVPGISNTAAGLTGTATFTCSNGTWTASGSCTSGGAGRTCAGGLGNLVFSPRECIPFIDEGSGSQCNHDITQVPFSSMPSVDPTTLSLGGVCAAVYIPSASCMIGGNPGRPWILMQCVPNGSGGTCGPINGATVINGNLPNMCASGGASAANPTSSGYNWTCSGTSCSANTCNPSVFGCPGFVTDSYTYVRSTRPPFYGPITGCAGLPDGGGAFNCMGGSITKVVTGLNAFQCVCNATNPPSIVGQCNMAVGGPQGCSGVVMGRMPSDLGTPCTGVPAGTYAVVAGTACYGPYEVPNGAAAITALCSRYNPWCASNATTGVMDYSGTVPALVCSCQ